MESKFVDLDGMRLHYGEGPANGPKLVLLTGFPATWEQWSAIHALLEPDHHLFSPTLRGMGRSGRAASYPIPAFIEDVRAFLHEVVGGTALGFGHSAGAWFGLAVAGRTPEVFSAFVSVDQPLDPRAHVRLHSGGMGTVAAMARAMRKAGSETELAALLAEVPASAGGTLGDHLDADALAAEAAELRELDPEIFAAWIDDRLEAWIRIPELEAWPGAYRNPLLFLDGDPKAGSMLDAAAVEYNRARYPWAERIELSGRNHSMGLTQDPAPVIEHARRFFADSGAR